jgi:hypothetical protein
VEGYISQLRHYGKIWIAEKEKRKARAGLTGGKIIGGMSGSGRYL